MFVRAKTKPEMRGLRYYAENKKMIDASVSRRAEAPERNEPSLWQRLNSIWMNIYPLSCA
jgi:hypothetical protein